MCVFGLKYCPMTQVFVIHGGTAFADYGDFLSYLKTKEIDIEQMRAKGWKDGLQESLGKEFQVVSPRMPNAQNAKYVEWKLWFERFIPFMQDGVVLVGHSLGAVFLAKYLSERDMPKRIAGTLLVAAPYDFDIGNPLPEFSITAPLQKFAQQGGVIILYHSKDDTVVPFAELQKFRKELPGAQSKVFEDRGHFNQETFPELVGDIKNLHG